MEKPSTSSGTSYLPVLLLALLVAIAAIIEGAFIAIQHNNYTMLAAGGVALVAVLAAWAIALAVAANCRASAEGPSAIIVAMDHRLQQIDALLTVISEQQLLSDRAKAVAFRHKDLEALRGAINEEITRKDWDAALVLANEMEAQFGYRQEAVDLRAVINNNRTEVVRQQIVEAVGNIDQLIKTERWPQAQREAERIMQVYPADESIKHLPQEIESRRQMLKKQLLDSWRDAVARKDVDGSIEILKKLDVYLTPAEAESMQETARGVFREKLNNLRSEFSKAVHDNNAAEQVRIAEIIMRDYPNSRIALELKDSIDALRARAAQPMAAGV